MGFLILREFSGKGLVSINTLTYNLFIFLVDIFQGPDLRSEKITIYTPVVECQLCRIRMNITHK